MERVILADVLSMPRLGSMCCPERAKKMRLAVGGIALVGGRYGERVFQDPKILQVVY